MYHAVHIVFVIVNVPAPVHSELPVRVQCPEMVCPLSIPVSANLFPAGGLDSITIPNWPFGLAARSAFKVTDPVAVSPSAKHGEFVVKLKSEMVRTPLLSALSDVPN